MKVAACCRFSNKNAPFLCALIIVAIIIFVSGCVGSPKIEWVEYDESLDDTSSVDVSEDVLILLNPAEIDKKTVNVEITMINNRPDDISFVVSAVVLQKYEDNKWLIWNPTPPPEKRMASAELPKWIGPGGEMTFEKARYELIPRELSETGQYRLYIPMLCWDSIPGSGPNNNPDWFSGYSYALVTVNWN